MFFYLFLAIVVGIFTELSFKVKNKYLRILNALIAILCPTFFFSVRYGIGTDYESYIRIFNLISTGQDTRMEWAYFLINKTVAYFGGSIEVVFFLVGIIMFLFIYLTLKDHRKVISPGLGMFIFILFYYQMSFNTIRQVVAVAVLLYSFKFIKDRYFIRFLLLIILASGFHISSLIMIPVYFIYNLIGKQQRRITRLLFYTVTLLIVIGLDKLLIPILSNVESLNYYLKYLDQESTLESGFGFIIRQLPFLAVGFYLYTYIGKYDKNFSFYYFMFIVSILFGFTRFVGADYIGRISLNFEIILVLLIPYLVRVLNNRRELFISWLLVCYIVIHWWYIYVYVGSHGTIPYQWIFLIKIYN